MSAKGKGLLSIAAVMVLGSIDLPAVAATGGWTAETVRKTDGDFSTGSATFVTVPGTPINFVSAGGNVVAIVSGTALPGADCPAVQAGVNFDGINYGLEAENIHTFTGGVAVFRTGLGGATSVPLPAGTHTAAVVILRRDLGSGPNCTSATVAASTELPLNFVIEHSTPASAIPTLSILGTVLLIGGLLTASLFRLRQRRITHST